MATQQSIKAYVDSTATADTLTEVLGNGNTTSGTDIVASTDDKVQFRDAAIYINSGTDGQQISLLIQKCRLQLLQ